jgi:hypothetical protein
MSRRLLLISLLLLLALTMPACVDPEPTGNTPWCDDLGAMALEAQSIPSTQFVPCLDGLPLGWKAGRTYIDHGGTSFSLHSDIAGREAVQVELVEECDVTSFARVPSDEAGTERYEFVAQVTGGYRGRRAYVFAGGCTLVEFRFEAGSGATLVNEASVALNLVPRSAINDALLSFTSGRQQLDPPADD